MLSRCRGTFAFSPERFPGISTPAEPGKAIHLRKRVSAPISAQRLQDSAGELEGGGGGQHHHRGVACPFGLVILRRREGHGGVGVAEIAVILPDAGNGLGCPRLAAGISGELGADAAENSVSHAVNPVPGQVLHAGFYKGAVPAGGEEEKPFQIGGHQNIHRGGAGFYEVPPPS